MTYDLDEQLAIDEIVNDWINEHVVVSYTPTGCMATVPSIGSFTIHGFRPIAAFGESEKEAKFSLKMMMVGLPVIQHQIATAWLYGQLLP